MFKWGKIIMATICLNMTLWAQSIDNFRIMTEVFPPYNLEENGKLKGIGVELLVKMLEKVDSKKSIHDIELLPWARAYQIVQKRPNTLLFSMFRTEARENMFKWVGPIDTSIIGLIARKDRNIKINSFDELKNYKIGTVKNDVAELLLIEQGYDKSALDSLSGTNSIDKSVKKLDRKRIDLFAYITTFKQWNLKDKSFNPDEYENVYTLQKQDLYFAFHKDTDDKLLTQLQNALNELKKSGIQEKIIKKYR